MDKKKRILRMLLIVLAGLAFVVILRGLAEASPVLALIVCATVIIIGVVYEKKRRKVDPNNDNDEDVIPYNDTNSRQPPLENSDAVRPPLETSGSIYIDTAAQRLNAADPQSTMQVIPEIDSSPPSSATEYSLAVNAAGGSTRAKAILIALLIIGTVLVLRYGFKDAGYIYDPYAQESTSVGSLFEPDSYYYLYGYSAAEKKEVKHLISQKRRENLPGVLIGGVMVVISGFGLKSVYSKGRATPLDTDE